MFRRYLIGKKKCSDARLIVLTMLIVRKINWPGLIVFGVI